MSDLELRLMKNTNSFKSLFKKPRKTNWLPIFSTAAFAGIAFGAAILLASTAMAEVKRTTLVPLDEIFVNNEVAAGTALVNAANIAVTKAEREDVKAFAGTLVTDHTKANADLAKLAADKNVILTKQVLAEHTQTLASLNALSGSNFDKVFISTVQIEHKKCIENFEWASKGATDTDVKTWATSMLPALRSHQIRANELSAALATTPATATTPDANNTAQNKRDRDAKTLTPLDQGNSKGDTDTTAEIRKAILAVNDFSTNAKNVKIITKDGLVTLRGPVKSAEEKRQIGDIAMRIAGDKKSDNQLEIENVQSNP